jgi:hypothetical protein
MVVKAERRSPLARARASGKVKCKINVYVCASTT